MSRRSRSAGELLALASVAALAFAACSSTGSSPSPPRRRRQRVAAAVGRGRIRAAAASGPRRRPPQAPHHHRLPAEGHHQPVLRRRQGRRRQGRRRARGSTVTQVGPNEAKADLQIPFITDLTTQKVNAIIISADGKDEVAPALKAAMAPGIKVVGFDSSPAVGAYDVFVNQVDFSGVGVNLADWACELAPNCTGDIAILSAAATATEPERLDRAHEDDPLDRRQVRGPQARRHRLRR